MHAMSSIVIHTLLRGQCSFMLSTSSDVQPSGVIEKALMHFYARSVLRRVNQLAFKYDLQHVTLLTKSPLHLNVFSEPTFLSQGLTNPCPFSH